MDTRGFDSINVIPFIDIMLVMLTIVLTTATFISSGAIPIKLPQAEAPPGEAKGLVQIDIDRQGILYFENSVIDLSQLEAMLVGFDRQRPVVIRADHQVALQAFVGVMDLLRHLDFKSVSLQTEAAR